MNFICHTRFAGENVEDIDRRDRSSPYCLAELSMADYDGKHVLYVRVTWYKRSENCK